jgi:hypothetical protein
VPVICVPAARRFDDQHERARQMARLYGQFHVWQNPDVNSLAALIVQVLQTPITASSNNTKHESQGAELAAAVLLESIGHN